MTPKAFRNKLQKELKAKLAKKEPHARIYIFEDESAYITNHNKQVLKHDVPRNSQPRAMQVIKWHSSSPICIWYRGKRR